MVIGENFFDGLQVVFGSVIVWSEVRTVGLFTCIYLHSSYGAMVGLEQNVTNTKTQTQKCLITLSSISFYVNIMQDCL